MYNERNHSIYYTTATSEVHSFKNKNKNNHWETFLFIFVNTRLRHSTWWESNKLINHSKYIVGSGVKQVISCEYCGTFKITCFEEHLRPATSIRCYFDTINLKQSGFCTTYYFKIFVRERKYKINLKNNEH